MAAAGAAGGEPFFQPLGQKVLDKKDVVKRPLDTPAPDQAPRVVPTDESEDVPIGEQPALPTRASSAQQYGAMQTAFQNTAGVLSEQAKGAGEMGTTVQSMSVSADGRLGAVSGMVKDAIKSRGNIMNTMRKRWNKEAQGSAGNGGASVLAPHGHFGAGTEIAKAAFASAGSFPRVPLQAAAASIVSGVEGEGGFDAVLRKEFGSLLSQLPELITVAARLMSKTTPRMTRAALVACVRPELIAQAYANSGGRREFTSHVNQALDSILATQPLRATLIPGAESVLVRALNANQPDNADIPSFKEAFTFPEGEPIAVNTIVGRVASVIVKLCRRALYNMAGLITGRDLPLANTPQRRQMFLNGLFVSVFEDPARGGDAGVLVPLPFGGTAATNLLRQNISAGQLYVSSTADHDVQRVKLFGSPATTKAMRVYSDNVESATRARADAQVYLRDIMFRLYSVLTHPPQADDASPSPELTAASSKASIRAAKEHMDFLYTVCLKSGKSVAMGNVGALVGQATIPADFLTEAAQEDEARTSTLGYRSAKPVFGDGLGSAASRRGASVRAVVPGGMCQTEGRFGLTAKVVPGVGRVRTRQYADGSTSLMCVESRAPRNVARDEAAAQREAARARVAERAIKTHNRSGWDGRPMVVAGSEQPGGDADIPAQPTNPASTAPPPGVVTFGSDDSGPSSKNRRTRRAMTPGKGRDAASGSGGSGGGPPGGGDMAYIATGPAAEDDGFRRQRQVKTRRPAERDAQLKAAMEAAGLGQDEISRILAASRQMYAGSAPPKGSIAAATGPEGKARRKAARAAMVGSLQFATGGFAHTAASPSPDSDDDLQQWGADSTLDVQHFAAPRPAPVEHAGFARVPAARPGSPAAWPVSDDEAEFAAWAADSTMPGFAHAVSAAGEEVGFAARRRGGRRRAGTPRRSSARKAPTRSRRPSPSSSDSDGDGDDDGFSIFHAWD